MFQYDTENQLVLAEIKKNSGESQTWEYAYDPFGRRLSKERTDKGALTATVPKQTHFIWDGSRLLQEYNYRGSYSYIYTDQNSYKPLAQIFDNAKDGKQYLSYFHNDQIGIPRGMTDQLGNLLWYGEYTAWGRLKIDERVYQHAHQPFRLQNQYCDEETGLHYNLMRYYEPDSGRFMNQDPIGLMGGDNLYQFAPNTQNWIDILGLAKKGPLGDGNLGGTRANSQQLGRNMALEGRPVTSGQAAGHIVASGGRVNQWEPAVESRQILRDYNIDINDPANGIAVGHPRPHNEMHNREFHEKVRDRLRNVVETMKNRGRGKKAIRRALRHTLRQIGKGCNT